MYTTSSITDIFLDHLQSEKRYSAHTITSYRHDLGQFEDFIKLNYNISPPEVDKHFFIREWVVSLSEQNFSARTINRKIACLKSFYKFLQRRSLIEKNPMQQVASLKSGKTIPVFLTEESIAQILDHFSYTDDFPGTRDKLVIELLYGTGIRLAELVNTKDSDINLYEKLIKITGKGNKERFIPLNKSLAELIKLYSSQKTLLLQNESKSFIVTDNGKAAYPGFIYRLVKKYLSMIPVLEKTSPHVLRHTFATHLLNKGADLNAIKDLLGHSSLAATQVYTHNSLDKIKAIFDQAHPKA